MKERLFKAYYTEGRDLGKIDSLLQLATELGLDEAETRKVLNESVYAKEVLVDQQHAYEIGVQGVPFFVFNNKYAISGAQQPETFARVLEKVWDEERPALVVEQGEGFCGINGNCN